MPSHETVEQYVRSLNACLALGRAAVAVLSPKERARRRVLVEARARAMAARRRRGDA